MMMNNMNLDNNNNNNNLNILSLPTTHIYQQHQHQHQHPSGYFPQGLDMLQQQQQQQQQRQEPIDASKTLFLGDLSYFCTEEDLCALFIPYGQIVTVRVRRGVTGESLMHGFIGMDTQEAARNAIRDLDGAEFMGRCMRVQLSSDAQRPNPVNKESFVQVHVSFISKQLQILVTEKILRDIFEPFGRIADVTVKKHTTVAKQNRQSGYGFVYFTDVDAANRAMSVLKHNTVREITFDCSISHKSLHDKVPSRTNSGMWQMDSYSQGPRYSEQCVYSGSTTPGSISRASSNDSFYRTSSSESVGFGRPNNGRFNVSSNSRIMSPNAAQPPLPPMRRTVSGQQEHLVRGDDLEKELNRLSLNPTMSDASFGSFTSGYGSSSSSDYGSFRMGNSSLRNSHSTSNHNLMHPVMGSFEMNHDFPSVIADVDKNGSPLMRNDQRHFRGPSADQNQHRGLTNIECAPRMGSFGNKGNMDNGYFRPRQLSKQGFQNDSFYGDPIASVSMNSSDATYMKDLDNLLAMPVVGSETMSGETYRGWDASNV